MKPIFAAFMSIYCLPAFAIITFTDNRSLIQFDQETPKMQQVSKSIFTFFPKDRLSFNGATYDFTLKRNHQQYLNLCPGERFNDQPAPGGFCTGFMIADDIGMTAGHCVSEEVERFCQDHYVVFDYLSGQTEFDASQVKECEEIIEFENYLVSETLPDYATIKFKEKLNKPVLTLADSSTVSVGQEILTIGHPKGLPQVLATEGSVIDKNGQPLYLEVQVDTFRGNSGGPILTSDRLEVVGIISAYKYNFGRLPDYDYFGTNQGCNKPIIQHQLSITVNASKLDFYLDR